MGLSQREVGDFVGVRNHAVWCREAGRMKPNPEHLVDLACRCSVSSDWLLSRGVVAAELLGEADLSCRNAVAGLPVEYLDEIHEFIR